MRFLPILLLFLLFLPLMTIQAESEDGDRDSLPDRREQKLLDRFKPSLRLHAEECASLPSEFQIGSIVPLPVVPNGTLYGQVFPIESPGSSEALIEIHYYHLWASDCGRFGHDLDAEYVAGLLYADSFDAPVGQWKARYWFGAAHEGTLCDVSNAAAAASIDAVEHGPEVWVSHGKHASFLTQEICQRPGCGGDQCGEMVPFEPTRIINVGEPGSPLNGALWAGSPDWPLREKMGTLFGDSGLQQFEGLNEPVVINGMPPPTKSLLLAGNKTIRALQINNEKVGDALGKAGVETTGAAAKSLRAVGRSLRAATAWLFSSKEEKQVD